VRDDEVGERLALCAKCPLSENGYCGVPRTVDPLTPRNEFDEGNGMRISGRACRPEVSCPRGAWKAAGTVDCRAETGVLDGRRVCVFIDALGGHNRDAHNLALEIGPKIGFEPFLLDERTPGVATNTAAARFYCHDFAPDEAEYVLFLSPELYLDGLPQMSFGDVSLHPLPSACKRYYDGAVLVSRRAFPLLEWCKDEKPADAFDTFIALAERTCGVTELPHTIFFPMRSGRRAMSRAVSLAGLFGEPRSALLEQMRRSPSPWREVCRHFAWTDELREAPPYPQGTEIDLDCYHAGIGDLIDVCHIARALEIENPGVIVKVHSKTEKSGFVKLFGKHGQLTAGGIVHRLPPNPWHALDFDRRAKGNGRIENWALHCGATKPVLAEAIIGREADAWATEFLDGLPEPRVVLSPVSTCPTRSWPMERYEALGRLLEKEGFGVVVMDDPDGVTTFESPFRRLFGVGAEREAAAIKRCSLLVGNDSGMAHLSASLQVPTLVLCGPTDGKSVFGWYDSARWIDGKLPCAGCYFFRENGWREECQHGCLALRAVDLKSVFLESVKMVHSRQNACLTNL